MGNIITSKPLAPTPVVHNPPKVAAPQHKTPLVDTKYTPISSLITFVEGYWWKVNYYSQVIDTGSQLLGQDPGLAKQHQQYKLIKNLEIKAKTPINWSQDQTSKSMTAQGQSIVHSSIIPNAGDMFIADVGDGRLGVFQVNTSTQLSLLKQTAYSIDYTLIYFTDDEDQKFKDLGQKVIVEYNYVRDFLNYGQDPLVTDTDFEAIQKLQGMYHEILNFYMTRFYSREYKTLLVPTQGIEIYDHYLMTFVNRTFNVNDHLNCAQMRVMNVGDDDVLKLDQLYTALIDKNVRAFAFMNRRMGVVSTSNFAVNPVAASIRFTRIDMVVYPLSQNEVADENDNRMQGKVAIAWDYDKSKTLPGDIAQQITDNIITAEGERPIIHPIHKDGYYVFSKAFYENTEGMSFLEILVLNYIHGRPNPPQDIVKVLREYHNWGSMERYYYLPITLALIKSVIRGY